MHEDDDDEKGNLFYKIGEDESFNTFIITLMSKTKHRNNKHAKLKINNKLLVIEILCLTTKKFCKQANIVFNDWFHYGTIIHTYERDTYFESKNVSYHQDFKTALMSSYFHYSSGKFEYNENEKIEYNDDGIPIQINHYNNQIYYLKDCVLSQHFKNKKFHEKQTCEWKNGNKTTIFYENGLKHGLFEYHSNDSKIIGNFEYDHPIEPWTKNNIKTLLPKLSKSHWRFIFRFIYPSVL